tara:strand:+ start:10117 stop:10407 length:291 start_codon:yes stop_codon:yes gene_type:complete
MENYLTKREYTGANVDTLLEAGYEEGDAFVTFKQALKLDGVNGKNLKGIRKAATLFFFKEKEDKETGEVVKEKKYFSVFDVREVFATVELNNKKVA